MPKDTFKIAAGVDTDMLDHLAALADDDAFLALALGVNGGVHAQYLLGLLERIADHANGVRDSSRVRRKTFSRTNSATSVSSEASVPMSSGNQRGPSGKKKVRNGLDKGIDVEVLDRRRHDLVVIFHELVRGLKLLHDLRGFGLIGLGEHQDLFGTSVLDAFGNPSVSPADRLGGINQKRGDIDIVQLEQRALVELGSQTVLGLMNTRGIDKDQLVAGTVDDGGACGGGSSVPPAR